MTCSDLESPKEPFPANDNFQEQQTPFPENEGGKNLPISADFSSITDVEPHHQVRGRSSIVSGAGRAKHQAGVKVRSPETDRFADWTRKTKIGRRRITRQLTLPQVRDLKSAWHHALSIGRPVNRLITIRPHDINDQNPEQRIETWSSWRNKLAQFARDNSFEFTCLWTRESKRNTAQDEHLHVLMHVPQPLQKRFDKVVEAWCDGTDEIDVRVCSYQIRRNQKGGEKSVLTYIAKNSPQAGRYLNHTIQLGGPIFGKRYGLSSNLTARARARHEVARGLRQDLRLPRISSGVNKLLPQPANDQGRRQDRRRAA
jgi:hypothetical protein